MDEYIKKATLVDENGNKSTGYYDTAKEAYAQMLEKARAQNETAANQQIANLQSDAQRTGTGLWSTYQQQMRKVPQQLAAMGITGGAAESSVIGAGNNYLQQIAELDRQRRAQENEVRMNQSTADNSAYQTYMNNLLALDQYNQDYSLREREMDEAQQQRAMQDALAYGDITGDYSIMANYGYSPEQVALLQKAWQVDNAKKYKAMSGKKSGGGGGSKGASTSLATDKELQQEVQAFLNEGATRMEIQNVIIAARDAGEITADQARAATAYLSTARAQGVLPGKPADANVQFEDKKRPSAGGH